MSHLPSSGHPVSRFLDLVYLACIWIAGTCVFLMSLFIPWGIFSRYVLGTGSQWPEPISILLMVTFTFLGAACSYRAGGHIAVDMLTGALPPPLQKVFARVADLLMAGVCLFVLWYGAELCRATLGQSVSELPWLPVGVTYLPIPLGAAATLLFVAERMLWGPQNARAVVRLGEMH